MSVFGIGIDIVQIDRMSQLIEKHAESFAKKVLHENELVIFNNSKQKERYLAKRFAAKEAFAKALGTGIIEGVTLPKIEVVNDALGRPEIQLHGTAKEAAESKGISRSFLSISDEKSYAIAQVLLEK